MFKFIIIKITPVYSNRFPGNNRKAMIPTTPVKATTPDTTKFCCQVFCFLLIKNIKTAKKTDKPQAHTEKCST